MYKLNNKVKVEELKSMLKANAKAIKAKDKNLFDRMMYAGKHQDKTSRADLMSLAKEAITLLGEKFVVPAMAEEPQTHFVTPAPTEKPEGKKLKSKDKPKAEPKAEVKAENALKPKASQKKEAEKPEKSAKSAVTPKDMPGKKSVQIAELFPESLEVEGETYSLATDIKDMKALHKALTDGADLILAFYWSPRHLKQFPYFNGLLGQPKSFDNDLDLANVIYISDEYKVAYAVSLYTEGVYSVFPDEIKESDGLRFASGIEFQIYIKK